MQYEQLQNRCLLIYGLLTLLLCSLSLPAAANILHQERSLYQNILVTEDQGMRCLAFASKTRSSDRIQSCEYTDNEDTRLALEYVKMSFVGLLINNKPERILIIGLGGGSVPKVMHQLYPDASIDIVELDPAVVKVAQEYFSFTGEDNSQNGRGTMHISISDARVFSKKAALRGQEYDYILLDAFNGDYIPEHLMTSEFLQELKSLLTAQGVLVANTFSTSQLYAHESVTYQQVFGRFLQLTLPRRSGNRIILAMKHQYPSHDQLMQQADTLFAKLAPFSIPIRFYSTKLTDKPDWDTRVRALTDQYSPANLLR